MNGKCLRAGGVWSRAAPRRRPAALSAPDADTQPLWSRPIFPQALLDKLGGAQLQLAQFFSSYPFLPNSTDYAYNQNMPYSVVYLRQSDFNAGTVRLTRPGVYVLKESILFSPNPSNDFQPTTAQIASGLYPVAGGAQPSGAYHLGFFAAITIEAEDIVLDLNGFTIRQSEDHRLHQRFYSNIELGSAPFITGQGPGNFSTDSSYKAPTRTLIMNGYLGRSSHHGIHGNAMTGTLLYNLSIFGQEVAGIALNGALDSVIAYVTVQNIGSGVPVLAAFSQGKFARNHLATLAARRSDAVLDLHTGRKTVQQIADELQTTLDNPGHGLFSNPTGLLDGNIYGILLNVRGIAVNDFLHQRPQGALGNERIHLQDVVIKDLASHPREMVAVSAIPDKGGAYGGSRLVGPAGDILHIEQTRGDDGKYRENSLANAQLILAKYNDPKLGTTNIPAYIVTWAEQNAVAPIRDGSITFSGVEHYLVPAGDAMGHTMKGNIGLFVSGGHQITGQNISVVGLHSKGSAVGTSQHIPEPDRVTQGADATGITIAGSSAVTLSGVTVSNVTVDQGSAGAAREVRLIGSDSASVSGRSALGIVRT